MKTQPITQKAKCSPLKVNEALISGAGKAAKKFTNISKSFGEGMDEALESNEE